MKKLILFFVLVLIFSSHLEGSTSSVSRKPKSQIGSYVATSNGATFYMGLYGNATDTTEANLNDAQLPPGMSFIIKNFHAQTRTAPGGTASWNVALKKNGASSDLLCTIYGTDTECNDITNTATFASGDLLTVQFTEVGAATGSAASSWSALVEQI